MKGLKGLEGLRAQSSGESLSAEEARGPERRRARRPLGSGAKRRAPVRKAGARRKRGLRLALFSESAAVARSLRARIASDELEVAHFDPSKFSPGIWESFERFDAILVAERTKSSENGLTRWLRKTCPDVPLISLGKPSRSRASSIYALHLKEVPAGSALRPLVQHARRHLQSSRKAAKLTRRLRETARRLQVLGGIVSTANSILEPRRVVNVIMAQIQELIPSEAWSILLVDEETGELAFEMALGENSSDLSDTRIKLGEGVAGWVALTGQPAIVNDVRRDRRFQRKFDQLTRFRTRSILCAPLTSRGRTIGVVEIMNRTAGTRFTKKDMNLLLTLVEPAAIALENAILFQKTEQLAVTDDLTKLYNSRYVNVYLEQAIPRAKKAGSSLAVMFLDLDGFKSINDRHGHFYGSRSLREVGTLIRAAVREEDVVSRYGGDEFVVVLPETDLEGALAVAERIRQSLRTHVFLSEFGLEARLSASFGVSLYPDHGHNPQDLMQKADQAMYSVKERGKDAVCLAS
jgi:diguanylate cyclase (GGDEF)-like protein